VSYRINARQPNDAKAVSIEKDAAIVSSFLSDAAHVPGGFAAGVAFPASEGEVASVVAGAARVLPIGAQSSLTGGATPRGDVVLSTRSLKQIEDVDSRLVRVGAGVRLSDLQMHLANRGLYYPPVPTFTGAFVGGTVSTNAAGAATFKYGSVRPWVHALTVVLADGAVLDVRRGDVTAVDGVFEIVLPSGKIARLPVPSYTMPDVPKLSAGYYARRGMDLVDLFVGSEGTLGVIVDATLRVISRQRRSLALVQCNGDEQAIAVTALLRKAALEARRGQGDLDVAAIEYMDSRALRAVADEVFAKAAVRKPRDGSVLLLLQIELRDEELALAELDTLLERCGVEDDPSVTAPDDDRGAQRLLDLREAVPASVNAIVAAAKASSHQDIEKTAGDMVVPFDRLRESIALYRHAFESRGLDYAIWGHVSDGNLHPNVVPASFEDVEKGRNAILEIARHVIQMGGAPLAEHGVGRSALKQRLLRELYGASGIEEMRAVKGALDPEWKLSPGVLFPERSG
jgi:D-lactate dehydrogenase (cytochrome)